MGDTYYDSDKITAKEFEYGGKCFYFEIPNNLTCPSLNIKAIGSSWMVFNSTLAEISIPYSHSSFNDQKQWIHLKNKNEEDIICLLASLFCDFSTLDTSTNLNITKNYINTKAEISYEVYPNNNQMISMLNCTTDNKTNMTYNYGYNNNFNSGSCEIDDLNNTIKNTNDYNTNNGPSASGNLFPSTTTNNILSPFSERNNTTNFLIENNLNTYNDNIFASIHTLLEQSHNDADPEVYDRVKAKVNLLLEKEEKIKQQQLKNDLTLERIKEKESQLSKEKTILEDKIRKFKETQSDFEKKNNSLTQNTLLFENDLANYIIDKEIYENSKENFFLLNYSLSTGQDIPIVSMNDFSSSSFTTTHLSKNVKIDMKKFSTKKENKKKEIVIENANKYVVIKPKRDSQSQSSSSSSNKINKQLNNTNIGPSINNNNYNSAIGIGIGGLSNHNLNSTTINVSDINMNNSNNIEGKNNKKISPPIAQINLNFYDYQTPKNEKFIENRLLDSLEGNLQGGIGNCFGFGIGNGIEKHQKGETMNINETKLKKRNEGNSTKFKNNPQGSQGFNKPSKSTIMPGKSIDKMNSNIILNQNSNSNSNSTMINGSNFNTHQASNISNGKRDFSSTKNDVGSSMYKFKKNSKTKV